MATFSYQAKDGGGNLITGVIDATEEREAATALREMGYWPLRIGLAGAATAPPAVGGSSPSDSSAPQGIDPVPFLTAVPLSDLAVFYRQIGTLANAGVPMTQSLMTLAQQSRSPRLREILNEAANSVASGHPFSATMIQHPAVFPEMQIALIQAGEAGGMVELMCRRIAEYLEREIELRRKLSRETLYPKFVLGVAGCVILLLSFLKAGAEGVYSKLTFGLIVTALIVGGIWFFKVANQNPAFGAAWDKVKMMIPGPGGVARRYATARFTRALSALYGAGVLLPRAVAIAARACGNRAIGQTMIEQIPVMMSGGGVTAALEASGLLSPIAVQMARTGEYAGNLDAMMDKVADYLESEADQKAHQQAVGLGVAAIVIAGIIVAMIAISFYGGMMSSAIDAGKE